MTWRKSVNQTVGSARINAISDYLGPAGGAAMSAIDTFYSANREILNVGTPTFLAAHPNIGPLLLVGVVSATENFFRDIFAGIINICPVAKSAAADQTMKIGSVLWHGKENLERGAFEHTSFADSGNIISNSHKFIGYQMKKTAIFEEFEKVCQLRHAIVHSGANLAGQNAIRLQLSPTLGGVRVNIGFAELQESANICTTLVTTVNQDLFAQISKRWAVDWPKLPFWDIRYDHNYFKKVWQCFFSEIDATSGAITAPMSLMKCKNCICSELR